MVQGLGFWAFTAMAQGSILGWGPEIPQAQQLGQKKKKLSLVRIKLLLIKILSMSTLKKSFQLFFFHIQKSHLICGAKNGHIH